MKTIQNLLLVTASLVQAIPQQPQQQQQQSQDPLQSALVRNAATTAALTAPNVTGHDNSVGFQDTNRAGFNPFQVKKAPLITGEEAAQGVLIVASVIAAFVIPEPFGMAIAVLLQGIAMLFAPRPPSPDQIYQEIYGRYVLQIYLDHKFRVSYLCTYCRIQNQINTVLNNHDVSKMVSNLQTLSQNINDQTLAYLAQMGITKNTQTTLHGMASGTVPIPFITSVQVDQQMKMMDATLGAPNNWYTTISQPMAANSAFVLANVPGLGANRCLHTMNFNLADGTDLVVDENCNLNSLDDKLFAVGPENKLIFRSNNGDKCITFNSGDGNDESHHLAIFDINSNQCKSSSHVMKLLKTQRDTWAIYDENRMMCVGDGGKDKDKNVLVSYRANGCLNDDKLEFTMQIPVLVNSGGSGGSSGNSITPPNSFDEIGVQLFYFSRFAGIHLASLKEMFLHGASPAYAQQQFTQKVKEYQMWLGVAIPSVEMYASFKGINATEQLTDAKNFRNSLVGATIKYDKPIQIKI